MKTKVALVLSGGGARGVAHIGVIEELEKQGFEITSIAGTSMGSVIGGVYALGKMDEFKNWLLTLGKRKVFSLVDFTLSSQGLVKGDKVFKTMKQFIEDDSIENLKINYVATATDVLNRKEVIFDKGSVYDAMRASVAIPTLFTPVKTESRLLVDGGVLNNIPVNCVKRTPNDLLVVVNVGADIPVIKPFKTKKEEENNRNVYIKKMKEFTEHLMKMAPAQQKKNIGYISLINETISIMMEHISNSSLDKFSPDILVEISRKTCTTFDFFKAEELVEIGRITAIQAIEEYENR